jgi:NADPH:quinone reductase
VIATASRPASAKWATELGADHIVDYFRDMPAQLKQLGFEQVDYVLMSTEFCLPAFFSSSSALVSPTVEK